jgi:hypothetical protein
MSSDLEQRALFEMNLGNERLILEIISLFYK